MVLGKKQILKPEAVTRSTDLGNADGPICAESSTNDREPNQLMPEMNMKLPARLLMRSLAGA